MLLLLAAACLSTPVAIIEADRLAAGGPAAPGTIVSHYATSGQGLTGNATVTVDAATGRFIVDERQGPVAEASGYDGAHAWMRDLSGFFSPQEGGDKPALARNEAYRLANLWWRPDRGGARIESLGCDALRVTPPGGSAFDAWFDPATHLLARVRERQSFGTVVETRYEAYERRGGALVATRIATTSGDDPATLEAWRLTDRNVTVPRRAAAFAMPAGRPADSAPPPGGRVTIPFRLLNNHVIVDVSVNGRGPFPFLVDTGGHDIVTPDTARLLSLDVVGSAPSAGAGEGTATNGFARVRELDVGGARLRDQIAVILDFSPFAVEGIHLGGMIGAEFFERFVVTIDYGARTFTIEDPARFHAAGPPAGRTVPFIFYEHMPQLTGTFDGRPARYNIDTGSRADVTMTAPFVARARLREAYPNGIELTDGWGVGGPSRSWLARAPVLKLGAVTVARPIASLSGARHGAFSDPAYDGNIGSGLLKRFVVTFDYGRRLIWLAPARRLDADTGQVDRTGMWVNLAGGGLEIMDILARGPAERAGLRRGDLIIAIDDAPFASRSLSEWRSLFKTVRPGRPIAIAYMRDGRAARASLSPRELVP